jgi:acetate CoA/acetoacetate CoA-transferase alpha subunit
VLLMQQKAISCTRAVELIPDGASLMIGGFLGVGSPHRIIDELVRQGKKNLTVIANDTGRPELGIGKLIMAKAVRKAIVSHVGTNPETGRQMIAGETEVELVPQGTLAERIRAGGFGLGGVLTATGLGTPVAEGKRIIEIDGKQYLLELPLRADFALLCAHRADYRGNLEYSLTARNFNMVMAPAADVVIAEPEHIVPVGMITPDSVATPFPVVDYLIERGQGAHGR